MAPAGRPLRRSRRPWLALVAVAALVRLALIQVDLTPKVEGDFFFASGDPARRGDQRIYERFGGHSQLIVLVSSAQVGSPAHLARVERLSQALERLPGVRGVASLTRGPRDLEDARESPLWRRVVLAGDATTSFIVASLDEDRLRETVASVETLVAREDHRGMRVRLAGVPYTVEVVRRSLVRDLAVFSAAAVIVFGAVNLIVFRSGWILLGTLVSCTGAVAAALLVLHVLGIGIGLLTVNLTTIVFVLAQSHAVFMISNWQRVAREQPLDAQRGKPSGAQRTEGERRSNGIPERRSDGWSGRTLASRARRRTLRAALGSSATNLLGFGCLLFASARPLQELGVGGATGAIAAFAAVFGALPAFLERARPPRLKPAAADPSARFLPRYAAVAVAAGCLLLGLGLSRLDTDPSLLAYFDRKGDVYEALAALDRSGGSSPLAIVVRRRDDAPLDSRDSYRRMWSLQRGIERDPAVGRALSLPVVMAEADRHPLAKLMAWRWMLDWLGSERTGGLLTRDRRQALYLLQMAEAGEHRETHTEIVNRLRAVAAREGFETVLVGGIYALQGRLADQVTQSLVRSLGSLVALIAIIASLAAGSLRAGFATGLGASLVALGTLGGFGALRIPLDVIAAPSVSAGIGLATDAALHLIAAWRRQPLALSDTVRWRQACRDQWRGILRSTAIVVLGFGLFALSSFPPTRRFGFGVAAATAIGAVVALSVIPALSRRRERAARVDCHGGSTTTC